MGKYLDLFNWKLILVHLVGHQYGLLSLKVAAHRHRFSHVLRISSPLVEPVLQQREQVHRQFQVPEQIMSPQQFHAMELTVPDQLLQLSLEVRLQLARPVLELMLPH